MELKMQSLMDSLCRCFGTDEGPLPTSTQPDHYTSGTKQSKRSVTPDGTSRRKSSSQKNSREGPQWDGIFDCNAASHVVTSAATHCVAPRPSGGRPPMGMTVEQAHAVAKAKLMANVPPASAPKRKRQTPDDIFRSKKNTAPPSAGGGRPSKDAFSRFLSNNPVIANSLCFATPIRGSQDEELDCNSVVSDTNTLNTAEDTITSTLYYEQHKLKGMKQRNPPMPLFGAYEVKESDDIQEVATSEVYSSIKMHSWVQQNPEMLNVEPLESERLKTVQEKEAPRKASPSSPPSHHQEPFGEDLPDMVNVSSDSTTGKSV